MNLGQALTEVRRQQNFAAVYDELVHVLEKAVLGRLEIPVDNADETVPVRQVQEVIQVIREMQLEHLERVQSLSQLEIRRDKKRRPRKLQFART